MARILTGIQSTGTPHLEIYWVQCFQPSKWLITPIMILFFYSRPTLCNPDQKRTVIQKHFILRNQLACGLDVKKTVFYRQSDISQVTELAWFLSCFPYQRHSCPFFQNKAEQLEDINTGLFNYLC